eukprot:SAG31_NODE_15094_length_771_cov_1.114583_1_plen_142_part_00
MATRAHIPSHKTHQTHESCNDRASSAITVVLLAAASRGARCLSGSHLKCLCGCLRLAKGCLHEPTHSMHGALTMASPRPRANPCHFRCTIRHLRSPTRPTRQHLPRLEGLRAHRSRQAPISFRFIIKFAVILRSLIPIIYI